MLFRDSARRVVSTGKYCSCTIEVVELVLRRLKLTVHVRRPIFPQWKILSSLHRPWRIDWTALARRHSPSAKAAYVKPVPNGTPTIVPKSVENLVFATKAKRRTAAIAGRTSTAARCASRWQKAWLRGPDSANSREALPAASKADNCGIRSSVLERPELRPLRARRNYGMVYRA